MALEIELKILTQQAMTSVKDLQDAVDRLSTKSETVNPRSFKDLAAAIKDIANASKSAATAEKANAQAAKENANAHKANAQAIIADEKASQQAQRTLQEEARTRQQNAKAEREETNARIANIREQKQELSLSKQLKSSHKFLGDTLRSLTLQYISLQRATASLRYAFSEMKDMSDQLAEYRKVTGATVQEMEQIRATAYDIAKAYGESASDVIASAANMARAGYRENSVAMAELATKTKLVGDMTQEAADKFLIAVDAAYKYQGNVEQLSAVLDAANEIDNNFATTIEKVSDGMTLVASLASTAHVPIEQLMAALGTMSAVTQRSGQETARGLRSIILNVMGDTSTEIEEGVTATEESVKSMTDALLKYGDASVKAAIQAGKVINPMEAIVALQKAWKENQISEQDIYQISNDVAGKRYYNVFTALIQNPEMYNEMLQSIATSFGSAQNEVNILLDSWSRKLEQLKTTWTEVVDNTTNENFVKWLIDAGSALLSFSGSLENMAGMALGAYTAIRTLAQGFKNLDIGSAYGGLNLAGNIIGVAVAGLSLWKSSYEYNLRQMQKQAEEAAKEATQKAAGATSLYSIQERYSAIAQDGIQEEQGELEELQALQIELNNLVGEQADAIDIVNGKYGDTITALKNLTEEQRKSALQAAQLAVNTSVANFVVQDLNGYLNFGTDSEGYAFSGVDIPIYKFDKKLQEYLDQTKYLKESAGFSFITGIGQEMPQLRFKKPNTAEEIVEFLTELEQFVAWVGTEKYTNGNYYSQESPTMFNDLQSFLHAVQDAASPVREAVDAQNKLLNGLEEIGGSGGAAEEASGSIGTLTESVDALTSSINAATNAKEKFDDAMKSTKADAFNDYMEAFTTFKEEMDAGRVNSTAMYAAARMMLGEEAYNATGGTYQGVMAAMNRMGSAGSVLDAYNMLNADYWNSDTGEKIQGYGVYELIQKSGILPQSMLTDAEGRFTIPQLSEGQIARISEAYGGILEEVIVNALNALDQYDIYGSATDAAVAVAAKESSGNRDSYQDAQSQASASMKEQIWADRERAAQEAEETAADFSAFMSTVSAIVKKVSLNIPDLASATADYTKAAAAEKVAEQQKAATEAAKEAAKALDNAVTRLESINATGTNADVVDMLNGLNGLKENYDVTITTTEKGSKEAKEAISEATEGPYNAEISTKENGSTEAQANIQSVVSDPYDAVISTTEDGSIEAGTAIETVADANYNAQISTTEDGSLKVKDVLDAVSGGPYGATVNVGDNGTSADVQEKIDAITGRDVGIALTVGNEPEFLTKISELTKPETKTINIEYGETGDTENGRIDSTPPVGGGDGIDYPFGEERQTFVDPLQAGIATSVDAIFGTDLYSLVPAWGKWPDIPEKNTDFVPVTAEEIQDGVSDAVSEGIENGVSDGLNYLHDESVWGNIPLAGAIEAFGDAVEETVADAVAGGAEEGAQQSAEEYAAAYREKLAKIYVPEKLKKYDEMVEYGFAPEVAGDANMMAAFGILSKFGLDQKTILDNVNAAYSLNNTDPQAFGDWLDETFRRYNYGEEPSLLTETVAEAVQTGVAQGLQEGFEEAHKSADAEQSIDVTADTTDAIEEVDVAIEEINQKSATIGLNVEEKKGATSIGSTGAKSISTGGVSGGDGADPLRSILGWASGTQNHPGGIALVNDGNGPEILVDSGRAFIANDGKPALVNLHKGAKVFTASETRAILGGGVSSFAFGTRNNYILGTGEEFTGSVVQPTGITGTALSSVTTNDPNKTEEEKAAEAAAEAYSASFSSLKDLIDYIIDRIGIALDEQIEIIDKQIDELKAQREAAEQQNELEEKQKAVADAMSERTVRYIDENGQWHWMADANKVQKAQKALSEYEDELAYKAQVEALEAQKTALQDQYKQITKAWSDIQYAINTPTGDLYQMLAEVIATGSATDKKGAETVQNLLIAQLLKGGIYSANYEEALGSIAKATSGNPIMPGESDATLASLIATATGMGTGTGAEDAMKASTIGTLVTSGYAGVTGGGTQINYNYFVNGIQLGSEQANEPLSSIMRNLAVYTNTGVA